MQTEEQRKTWLHPVAIIAAVAALSLPTILLLQRGSQEADDNQEYDYRLGTEWYIEP
jgi:negative regulator of sigma E activity